MRYMLTDDLWSTLGPLVDQAKRNRQGPRPELPDRQFFEALLYWARTGIAWPDMPAESGSGDAVSNRFRRWVRSASPRTPLELLTAGPALGEVRRVLIDSTTARAHRHPAGARRPKEGSRPSCRPRSRASAGAGAG